MKKLFLTTSAILLSTFLAVNAFAHDPKEHMDKAEKLDCSAMDKMDHSKMDMNDPVMQAMMKKCMGKMNHDTFNEKDVAHEHETKPAKSAHDSKSHDHH